MKSIIATAALVATTAASSLSVRADNLSRNASCVASQPYAKVHNRCSYSVYLWSVEKELGCPSGEGVELATGSFYYENYRTDADGGISLKISKTTTCGTNDLTQLEYKIVESGEFAGNYLDMSFVNCIDNLEDCPGRTDGFYLKSGNENGKFPSAVDNEHCPIFNVNDSEEAAKVSYISWDDSQTKWCDTGANLELYLCGGDAPSGDDSYSAAPVSSATPVSSAVSVSSAAPVSSAASSEIESSSSAQPIISISISESYAEAPAPTSAEDAYVVAAAAAVTSAPTTSAIKTEVVYVTEYVNRRHAHGRRHQHFHA